MLKKNTHYGQRSCLFFFLSSVACQEWCVIRSLTICLISYVFFPKVILFSFLLPSKDDQSQMPLTTVFIISLQDILVYNVQCWGFCGFFSQLTEEAETRKCIQCSAVLGSQSNSWNANEESLSLSENY